MNTRPMDRINQASIDQALRRKAERQPGVCIYCRDDCACTAGVEPHCPNWRDGFVCVDGDCSQFGARYIQPRYLAREHFGLEVGA